MITIVDKRLYLNKKNYDYVVSSESILKSLSCKLYKKISGTYSILADASKKEFVDTIVGMFASSDIDITIRVPEAVIEQCQMKMRDVTIIPKNANIELYETLVKNSGILLSKDAYWGLYRGVKGDLQYAEKILSRFKSKKAEVTIEDISGFVFIPSRYNPGNVLVQFLSRKRFRKYALKTVLEDYGEEHSFYYAKKVIKGILDDAIAFVKGEKTNMQHKNILIRDIVRLYKIFIEFSNVESLSFILKLFEEGYGF